jgi:hypothetical protein
MGGRHLELTAQVKATLEWLELAPRDGQGQAGGNGHAHNDNDYGLVIFENEEASLRVARGEDDSLELVVRVHGDEVTAYDLDGDQLASIGRRLLTLAARTSPAPRRGHRAAMRNRPGSLT